MVREEGVLLAREDPGVGEDLVEAPGDDHEVQREVRREVRRDERDNREADGW